MELSPWGCSTACQEARLEPHGFDRTPFSLAQRHRVRTQSRLAYSSSQTWAQKGRGKSQSFPPSASLPRALGMPEAGKGWLRAENEVPSKSCALEKERGPGRSREELYLESLENSWVLDSEWAGGHGERGVHVHPRPQSLWVPLSQRQG